MRWRSVFLLASLVAIVSSVVWITVESRGSDAITHPVPGAAPTASTLPRHRVSPDGCAAPPVNAAPPQVPDGWELKVVRNVVGDGIGTMPVPPGWNEDADPKVAYSTKDRSVTVLADFDVPRPEGHSWSEYFRFHRLTAASPVRVVGGVACRFTAVGEGAAPVELVGAFVVLDAELRRWVAALIRPSATAADRRAAIEMIDNFDPHVPE